MIKLHFYSLHPNWNIAQSHVIIQDKGHVFSSSMHKQQPKGLRGTIYAQINGILEATLAP